MLRRTTLGMALIAIVLGLSFFMLHLAWPLGLWHWWQSNHDAVTPIATFAGAAVVAWAALWQAKTASLRHETQSEADRQRRITESFSSAAEQLGSDKLAVRLGGIYTMERISRESLDDYWPVMETLTAFVRENARWTDSVVDTTVARPSTDRPQRLQPGESGMTTDIAAVLSVICRRAPSSRFRERNMGWRFDLRGTHLRRAQLSDAYLEGSDLRNAHLEGASLPRVHLERADLRRAHLEGASLPDARLESALLRNTHLKGANLTGAHLEGADLTGANLEGASLAGAHLKGAVLDGTHLESASLWGAHAERSIFNDTHLDAALLTGIHLEGADLSRATGLDQAQLITALGDSNTILPDGLNRPAHWPRANLQSE